MYSWFLLIFKLKKVLFEKVDWSNRHLCYAIIIYNQETDQVSDQNLSLFVLCKYFAHCVRMQVVWKGGRKPAIGRRRRIQFLALSVIAKSQENQTPKQQQQQLLHMKSTAFGAAICRCAEGQVCEEGFYHERSSKSAVRGYFFRLLRLFGALFLSVVSKPVTVSDERRILSEFWFDSEIDQNLVRERKSKKVVEE